MTQPIRIQRKRTKGYDMQAESRAINGLDCVYVGRPSRFGNPYSSKSKDREVSERVVELYRSWINDLKFSNPLAHVLMETSIKELRGKNLSCFCRLNQPCHADVLLELANR